MHSTSSSGHVSLIKSASGAKLPRFLGNPWPLFPSFAWQFVELIMSRVEPMGALLLHLDKALEPSRAFVELEPTETGKAIYLFTCEGSKDDRAHISHPISQKNLNRIYTEYIARWTLAHVSHRPNPLLEKRIDIFTELILSIKPSKGNHFIPVTRSITLQNERTDGNHEATESRNFQNPLILVFIISCQGIKNSTTSGTNQTI